MYVSCRLALAGLVWSCADMYVGGGPALAGLVWSYAHMSVPDGPALRGLVWSYADRYESGGPPTLANYAFSYADMYIPGWSAWTGFAWIYADMYVPCRLDLMGPEWSCANMYVAGLACIYLVGQPWQALHGATNTYAPSGPALAGLRVCTWQARLSRMCMELCRYVCTWRAHLDGLCM